MEAIATIQGLYFLVTGLWPVVNFYSFEKVTGAKVDVWLTKQVGLLAAAIGYVLLATDPGDTLKILAILSSLSFLVIDIFYSLRETISRIYLVDGVLQVIFIAWWLIVS